MKKRSTVAALICAAVLTFTAGILSSADEVPDKADEFKFTVVSEKDKTCKLTGGESYHDTYTIPAKSPEGYNVVGIGKYAVTYPKFKELIIPDGVELIEEGAFYGCHDLLKVQFPKTLKTIEKQAFYECYYLEELYFYDGLETIGEKAFDDCASLEKITFPGTLKSIGNDNLIYDGHSIDVYYDGTIEDYYGLFSRYNYYNFVKVHCSKVSTPTPTPEPTNTPTPKPTATPEPTETPVPTLPPVTATPVPARQVLPGPIGRSIMMNANFITANGISYKIDKKEATVIATTISGNLIIPDNLITPFNTYKVTGIADQAFKGNKTIKSVTIGANVKKIGKEAFSSCKKLKKITIRSAKLKPGKIGKNAFKGIYKKAAFKVPKKYRKSYKKVIKKMLKGAKII